MLHLRRSRSVVGLALGSVSRGGEHTGADGGCLDAVAAEAALVKRSGHQMQHAIT